MAGRYPLVIDANGRTSELPTTDYLRGVPWGFGFDKDLTGVTLGADFVEFATAIQWVIPASIPNGLVKTNGTGPSSQTDIDLQVNGTSVGTIRFATSATSATFIKGSDTTVTSGQTVKLVLPGSLNSMTGRLFGSIVGYRS